MSEIDQVTRATYETLLNRVAERLVQSEMSGKRRRLAHWRRVESWLKVRMHFAAK